MNIFVLDQNPMKAAIAHCDKHVNKLAVETYQMMGSALRRHGATDEQMPLTRTGQPLVGGYKHHPVTKWVGETRSNFDWAAKYGIELAYEFEHRYGKQHFCFLPLIKMSELSHLIPEGQITPFVLAMPEQFRQECPVLSYRDYYFNDKRHAFQMLWEKGRSEPDWWTECVNLENLTN